MNLSESLINIAKTVGNNADRHDLGEPLKKKLSDIEIRLQVIAKELVRMEDYVILQTGNTDEQKALGAPELAKLPMEDLIDKSALMGALYRAGIDLHRHTVFSATEEKLAASIAENYSQYSAILRSYRQAIKNAKTITWTMSFSGGPAVLAFIKLLERNNIIEVKKTLLQKDSHWVPHKFEYLRNANSKQNLRLLYKIIGPELSDFLKGDWMTAFTSQIVADHLNRNRIAHETFSKVSYQAPVDLISARSDFDVITNFDNRVLCFECKSGVVRDAEMDDIAEKSGDIKKVLTQFLSHELEFQFFLIIDGELNDKDAIRQRFSNFDIAVLEIAEVRKLIFDLHSNPVNETDSVLVLA